MSEYNSYIAGKCKDNNLRVCYRYVDPETGEVKNSCKRFKSHSAAVKWKNNELPKLIEQLENRQKAYELLTMAELIEEYLDDFENDPENKESTFVSKSYLIKKHIEPYWGKFVVHQITSDDVRKWQLGVKKKKTKTGNHYSSTYLRSIDNQLSAIFNFAVDYKGLPKNPIVKRMGGKKPKERTFWELEEYFKFIENLEEEPEYYYAFQTLFWSGIRIGELLALTPMDLNRRTNTLNINKNFQVVKGNRLITSPKTETSIRVIAIPEDLVNELSDYLDSLGDISPTDRIFSLSKSALHRAMKRGCEKAGMEKITLHGLRHSHITMLANLDGGYSTVDIAYRAGHSKTSMTNHYTHRYGGTDAKIAQALNQKMGEKNNVSEKI